MTVHLADSKGTPVTLYASDIVPRVGDTIQMPRGKNKYEVLKVTHLLNEPTYGLGQDLYQEVVRCIVRTVKR